MPSAMQCYGNITEDNMNPLDLTVEEIEQRVTEISNYLGDSRVWNFDDEEAHIQEDAIRGDVLRAIAAGHSQAQQLAAAALKTEDIKFDRGYV